MKKIQAFAIVAVIALIATPSVFAQTANTVQKMAGIKGISLRTYCSFSTLFRAQNTKCFDASKVAAINTASVGAIDVGTGSVPNTSAPAIPSQPATIGGFTVPTAPQVVERTVIVQGAPGPQGPAGQAGASAFGSFTNVPQVFWNGGGGSSAPTTVTNVVSGITLPVGGLPGQVLTLDASSTPVWQTITLPSASGTPSILGSLANLFATNGLTLATTSTSTTLKLGGTLTEDTTISQDLFNFGLSRSGFSFLNQGTTSIPFSSTLSIDATQFLGLKAIEGTQSVFAGLQRRSGPAYPIFEVQALDSASENRGYLGVGNAASYFGTTNGTTTNQIRTDLNRVRLNVKTGTTTGEVTLESASGVTFNFGGVNKYTFPKVDGLTNTILTTDGLGQLRYENISIIVGTSSTSTINAWGLNGNSGIDATTNFLGTTDAQGIVVKTNNVERARFAANGNFSLFTNDQNASSSITVKGIHSDGRWGIFDESNNKLIQNRSDAGILGFGTGDFVSYGFSSAMGIRGADVMIPHLVVGGNITGPNNVSQLRMESSSQTEYDYAGAYPNRANTYKISTNLSAPLPGAIRAPIAFGGRELNFFSGADDTGTPELTIAENGNVGIGTSTPMRPLTVVGNVGGTLAMFQNTQVGQPAGMSFLATRADSSTSNRIGLFLNPNASGDDRLATHASGVGDLWSFSRGGDLVGALGTSFDQRNDVIPARLSVMANDTRPTALFQNGAQSYVQIKNGSGAFPQSYNVGVEAAGGTFNIVDADAAQTRLSINRNGNVQIYSMLNVGSYGFGLGDSGDAGFGNSAQAYMRYVQRQAIGDAALELYDSQNNLSTVISQSSAGTDTEFNRTNKDIDFRIAGMTDNNLFFADASANNLGIGTLLPTEKLEVAGNIKLGITGGNGSILFPVTVSLTEPKIESIFASNALRMSAGGASVWLDGSGKMNLESGINGISYNSNHLQGLHQFMLNGVEVARIGEGGRLGLGTNNPQFKLDVDGDAEIGQVRISNSLAGFPSPTNAIEFWHGGNLGGGNNGTGIVAGGQTNGTKLLLSSANMDGSGQFEHPQLGRIMVRGNGGKMSFNAPTGIATTSNAFSWTVGDVSAAVPTQYERMVLNQDGSLGLGTSAPARKLHVVIAGAGQVARFQNADGTCNINPSIFLAFNCLSDKSLKKDIVTLTPSLAVFSQLNPVNYHWNTEDSASPLQYGFIAQEIEAIFPSFVTTDEETGIKSVAFGNLIPVTVKAIQEMNVALGDLSKDTTPDTFAGSVIYKRFTDAFKALTVAFKNITADKATVKELCLPKSDGTVICLSGDQVAAIAASAGVNLEPVVEVIPAPVVPPPAPVVPPPTPVEIIPAPLPQSESPANPAPEVVLESEQIPTVAEIVPTVPVATE